MINEYFCSFYTNRFRISIIHILESSSLVCRHGRSSQFRSAVIMRFLHRGSSLQRSVVIGHRYRYRIYCVRIRNPWLPVFSRILFCDLILISTRLRESDVSESFCNVILVRNCHFCCFDSIRFCIPIWHRRITACGQQESKLRVFKVFHIPRRITIRQLELLLHFKVCRTVKRSRISFVCVGIVYDSLLIADDGSCGRYVSVVGCVYNCVISGGCSCKVCCFGFRYSIGGSGFQTIDLESLPIF